MILCRCRGNLAFFHIPGQFADLLEQLVLVVLFSLFVFGRNRSAWIAGRRDELYVVWISLCSMVFMCFALSFGVILACLGFQRRENKVVTLGCSFEFPLSLKIFYFTKCPPSVFLPSSFAQGLAFACLSGVFAAISPQHFDLPFPSSIFFCLILKFTSVSHSWSTSWSTSSFRGSKFLEHLVRWTGLRL